MSNSKQKAHSGRRGKSTKPLAGNGPVVNDFVVNDKGHRSYVRSASKAEPISVLISRRQALLMGIGVSAGLAACSTNPLALLNPAREAGNPSGELPTAYQQQVLIRWGDPLRADAEDIAPAALNAKQAAERFGYNNDYIAYLPLPYGSMNSEHGLLFANHEYPIPQLMFKDLTADAVPAALNAEQIAATMAAVGMSVVEIKRKSDGWQLVDAGTYNRRITATTAMALSGPAAGHAKMKTADDPSGRLVLGTHDNCNGGVTPWGTVLSGEEGSQDFFGGDIRNTPNEALLARYHYDAIGPEGKFAWPRIAKRFDINQEPNEVNRFEWIVELDPYDPHATPVKRTALGRFAHEGAHCVVAPDGRLVVYMGDDWEFEYCYRFVSTHAVNQHDRTANKDLLDYGELSVAVFDEKGTLQWKPLVFGNAPLTTENDFADQGDVLIQTRRAADLLGATPMDCPEGYIPDPATGKVYIGLSGNSKRSPDTVNAANPRAPNTDGHLLELTPPNDGTGPDHTAAQYEWEVKILCDEDHRQSLGFHPNTPDDGYFYAPDNINFDPQGLMWICSDGPNSRGEDGLWYMATTGNDAWLSRRFFRSPFGAECCGPAFTPDGRTMFVAIQHPSGDANSIADVRNTWPDFIDGEAPRPSVLAITRKI